MKTENAKQKQKGAKATDRSNNTLEECKNPITRSE